MSRIAPLQLSWEHIDQHHFVARYLAGQLSVAECEAFETYIVAHPEILHSLELTARFKLTLLQLEASGELARCRRASEMRRRAWPLAVAASLAAFGVAGWWGGLYSSPTVILSAMPPASTAVTAAYEISKTRSLDYDTTIALSAESHSIKLRISPAVLIQAPLYRLSLALLEADDARTNIATVENLRLDEGNGVTVYLSADCLAAAVYELTLWSQSSTATPSQSSFLIQVQRQGPWKPPRCQSEE